MVPLKQHKNLTVEEWNKKSLAYQMANIGSEVSRSIRSYKKNPTRFEGAFERALELFDITIECAQLRKARGQLREICRAREEFCDYFDENNYNTDPIKMQKYYDDFCGGDL